MDHVALADAKIMLVAGMAGVLLETDDEKALRSIFEECVPSAKQSYAEELNAVIRRRNAGQPPMTGPAVTRQYWAGMISKIYTVFGEQVVREFFESMLERVKDQKAKGAAT
jgi:hypothetical protein